VSTYHLELHFSIGELVSPVARVYVKMSSRNGADSPPYISPDCASPSEFDETIRCLHAELDDIQKRAHAKFAAERRQMQKKLDQETIN
jgi:hypothetical protein